MTYALIFSPDGKLEQVKGEQNFGVSVGLVSPGVGGVDFESKGGGSINDTGNVELKAETTLGASIWKFLVEISAEVKFSF